jgi:hypothetical protein
VPIVLDAGAWADELAVVRSHVGSTVPPSDDDLRVIYDRVGSPEATALEVLRGRLADMLNPANPARFTADGDYTSDHAANIKGLTVKITELEAVVQQIEDPTAGMVSTTRLVRAGRSR